MKKKHKKSNRAIQRAIKKRKIRDKGKVGKKCWCGRPSVSGGYCAEHL